MAELYIGLMSGTSMDGIDAALVEIDQEQCRLLVRHEHPLPSALIPVLNRLCQASDNEIDLMATASTQLAIAFAEASKQLLKKAKVSAGQVTAIGTHGQTIRHFPPSITNTPGFSLQIAHPAYIADRTGIDVIADFRTADMAAGGHGAPLVPAFHQTLFQSNNINRAIINIGGIANITWLPKSLTQQVVGFDTGPGNTLLDYWYQQHNSGHYDKNGDWGASGTVQSSLLSNMLSDPYFRLPWPKSTGRETFNGKWLNNHLLNSSFKTQDIQATLCRLSALTIGNELLKLTRSAMDKQVEVYICGGGARNTQLMRDLQLCLPDINIKTTAAIGLDPDWVEAVAFAWLAKRFKHKQTGNLPAVTGAKQKKILGALYPA